MYIDDRILNFTTPALGKALTSKEAMRLAIDYAFQGIGYVSPNPMVGCVIVDNNHKFLAGGYHHQYGDLHAETDAWKNLSQDHTYKDLIVYVTLEPCAHEGKQPSCAKALSKLPIRKVFYALEDPNPVVAGSGRKILQNAGLTCDQWDSPKCVSEAQELVHSYLWATTQNSPYVSLKVATDSQGVFALNSSKKLWITNERSRRYSHFLRAYYDAIVVGRDTVVQDNPLLDSRFFGQKVPLKPVVVIDPQAELVRAFPGASLNIFQSPQRRIFWAIQDDLGPKVDKIFAKLPIEPIALPFTSHKGLDMRGLLDELWQRQVKSLFIEGGAHAYAGFLDSQLVNRIYHFQTHEPMDGQNKRFWYEKCQTPPTLGEASSLLTLNDNTLNIYELKRLER